MPEITLKYSRKEIEEFIRQMLAMKGLASITEDMEFLTVGVNGKVEDYNIIIKCVPGELLNKCPMCQSMLHNGAPIVRNISIHKNQTAVETITDVFNETSKESNDLPEEEEGFLDPELGESTDPPSFDNKLVKNKGNSSMNSLLAANRRLTAQRERELALQKQQSGHLSLMPGESTKPPKPKKRK